MKKLIPLLAFSILLLVPVGAQNAFGTHPLFACPPPGVLNTNPLLVALGTTNFCNAGIPFGPCPVGYTGVFLIIPPLTTPIAHCVALPTPSPTPSAACQNGAVLDGTGHCVPDLNQICSTGTMIEPTQMLTCIAQAAGSMIGGALLEINSVSLLVGSIGVNPVITGLVGITLAGVAGQAVWFVHRRRKK